MLNENLNEIRKSIVRSDKLTKNGIPKALDYNICKNTNCYAYALGISFTDEPLYYPGFTECNKYDDIESCDTIKRICTDLENLGMKYRKIGLYDNVELQKNEYLIKAFIAFANYKTSGDFHFIRQDSKTGLWYHKFGPLQPELTEDNGSEPSSIFEWTTRLCYIPIAYFALEEN